ncbi:hypothetical protein HYV57_01010 [Candidatus Peregrinibacteria bacterium]|nr:hypothetical protein [Candidatus Peregrinibacteria bacterium]
MMLKKSLLKKSLATIVALTLFLAPIATYTAQAGALQDAIKKIVDNSDFDKVKATVLAVLDTAIQKIDSVKGTIENNTKLDAAVKQTATQTLDRIRTSLVNYKSRVDGAKTIDELRALNKEIVAYIVENKDAIKESIRQTIVNIGEKAATKAEELRKKLDTLLATLKVLCPSEKTTIETLENQLAELRTEIDTLKTALKSKDATAIKKDLADLGALSQKIAANVDTISSACLK